MLVALIGDIHANLPALEAVLAHADERGAEAFWNIGDFVGYGPFPEESVCLCRERGIVSVVGNYDLKVLKFPKKSKKWKRTKRREKWQAFKWAYEHLSRKSRAYLADLPKKLHLEAGGQRVLLTHGSPDSIEEHLYPDTPAERLAELAKGAKADMVVVGHSHQAFDRTAAGVRFINTGSVGRPDDGDPRATYALMHAEDATVHIEHFRVAYDVDRTVAAIRDSGLPEAFAQMLLQGRNLDSVLDAAG